MQPVTYLILECLLSIDLLDFEMMIFIGGDAERGFILSWTYLNSDVALISQAAVFMPICLYMFELIFFSHFTIILDFCTKEDLKMTYIFSPWNLKRKENFVKKLFSGKKLT